VLYSPHAFVTLSPLPLAKRWLFASVESLLSHLTDVIVCSSKNEWDHAHALGLPAHKLTVVVNGRSPSPAPDRQTIRANLGLAEQQVVIGFVGRLEAQKAPHRLIEACLKLLPRLPHLHLLMIGDGPERQSLQISLDRAGLKHRVTWLGAVDAVQYMAAMDVFAMPSLYEGFAYVLIEALHAGLPVVATPVGGVNESVAPGKNGIIVPHHPRESLVAALRQLGLDAGLRRRMAQASRERAGYFSIDRMVDSLESLYYQLSEAQPARKSLTEFPAPATGHV
jgi:glycosyltransferase involved in cell wall biosynthesis